MFCPSCGEFISADNPKTCPFCGFDVQHFSFPASRTYGVPAISSSPFAPSPEVPPAGTQGAVDADISKLDFDRAAGSSDKGSRRYIDKRLPRCPFCRSRQPMWECAVVTGWLNRANFRCQKCRGVLSVPMEATTGWKSPTSLFGGLGSPEYLRVEWVGDSPGMKAAAPRLNGGEFPLERLRTWADRSDEGLPGSAG